MTESKPAIKIPDWFGPVLAIAQHQDKMNQWYWWQRFLHRWLIPCQCCRLARKI